MEDRTVVFVSAVSNEFHRAPPELRPAFQSYRDVLKHAFRTLTPGYEIIVQEDLVQGTGDLLETLDSEVARSLIVVHLVGELAGEVPAPACVRRLHQRHSNLLFAAPELLQSLGNEGDISYTQWEIYLAFHHCKHRLVFEALPNAPRSPLCAPDAVDRQSQGVHRHRLSVTGAHRGMIEDQGDLARKTIRTFLHFRVDPRVDSVEPSEDAIAKAWANQVAIVQELGAAIRKPDPRAVPVSDPANVAAFVAAVRTCAGRHNVNLATIVNIAARHEETVRAIAAEWPTPQALYDQALAELALGDLTASQHTARRAADLALEHIALEQEDTKANRSCAIDALLLVYAAANVAHAVPNAIAALEEAGALVEKEAEPLLWAEVHEPLAAFLLKHGRYDRAGDLISDIVDIREEYQGENHPDLAVTLLLWAELLIAEARLPGAESVAARAERIFASQSPPAIIGIAAALALQAVVLSEVQRMAEAELVLRKVLAIDEQIYGAEHPSVAAALNNLAELLRHSDRPEEAEPLLRRALAIAENLSEADGVKTANYTSNLAGLLMQTNRLREAEPLARRALEIHEQILGPQHPAVATDLSSLGTLLMHTEQWAEAEGVLRRAVTISEQSFGPAHPKYARDIGNLALLLSWTNRVAEAERLMRRALAIYEASYGEDHPSLWGPICILAELLTTANRLGEAEPLMRRAVGIIFEFQRMNERSHPEWRRVLEGYAHVLERLGLTPERVREKVDQLAATHGCGVH